MSAYPYDHWQEEYDEEPWEQHESYSGREPVLTGPGAPPVSPLLLVLMAGLAFALFAYLIFNAGFASTLAVPVQAPALPTAAAPPVDRGGSPDSVLPASPETFAAPYTDYWVTQGPHGFSYGHMAIDIAAGKGEPIHAPIAGEVTNNFIDGVGNPVLVIENDVYKVTLLHGIYSATIAQDVAIGDTVGEESNIGYTTDMQGRLCAGRDCGYHTHLNVYDKRIGENVNPLDLLP